MNVKFSFLVVIALVCLSKSEAQRRKRPNQQTFKEHQGPIQSQSAGGSPECPEPDGFFADADQCDKYWVCVDGVAKQKLCPDGLVFLEAGSQIEKCEFPFAVDCTSRPKLQPAQASMNCPRKNGYFAHEDEKICDKFFFCVDGSFNAITCPAGLAYNERTGTCTWPDQAKKSFCSAGELFDFQCPKSDVELGEAIHPRFADPKDCQYFYVCIDGKVPRKSGCSTGTVFNEKSGQCDKPKNVPECKDWYKGILDYDEDGEIATSPRPKPVSHLGSGSRRKGNRPGKPQFNSEKNLGSFIG